MLNNKYPEYEQRHRELRTLIAQKNIARIFYHHRMEIVFYGVKHARVGDVYENLISARKWFKVWKEKEQQLGLRTEYVGE